MARKAVLYVEDNTTNFTLVERILTPEGFDVYHARDGLEGVRKAIEEKASLDLILMDINLPEIDGYETTTRLRAIPGFENIPILAVTVNTLQGDRSRSLAAGCDGYIPKPIDINTFADDVKSYLRGKRETLPSAEENKYLREHNQKLVSRLEESIKNLKKSQQGACQSHKLASVGEMAAGVLHELKNPMTSISFMAEYLLSAEGDEDKKRECLERILENVSRIQTLSQGLNSFARPNEEQKDYVDIAVAIEEVLALSEHELRAFEVEYHCEIEPRLPLVWGADGQLHHIFMNLIRNAMQALAAAKSGGLITRLEIYIKACYQPDAGMVVVDVSDTGVGVPDELKNMLFEPFFTTKNRSEGTGLGLHVARQIVDNMGGTIEVGDAEQGGARFTVRLPASTRSDTIG
jgi:C4-dicarboxylate-specific signal transduction histidine kinase